MKKFTLIFSLIALGELSALAQGTIQFNNASTFPILIASGTDAAALSAATAVGSNTSSVLLGGGPGQVTVALYVALASAPTQFFLAGTTTNSASSLASFQGTFHGGNPYTISSTIDGGAFTQGTTIDYYFTAQGSDGIYGVMDGTSAVGTGYVLGGGAVLPGVTFGNSPGLIPGFVIGPTPEPSTIAIGGLGVVLALLYRRRK